MEALRALPPEAKTPEGELRACVARYERLAERLNEKLTALEATQTDLTERLEERDLPPDS